MISLKVPCKGRRYCAWKERSLEGAGRSGKLLRKILEWWPNDYKEKLVLQLVSWFRTKVSLEFARKVGNPYVRNIVHVSD